MTVLEAYDSWLPLTPKYIYFDAGQDFQERLLSSTLSILLNKLWKRE